MDVTLMLFWSLLTIGVLTIIFSNSIARYITTQKLKKLEAEQNVKNQKPRKLKKRKTKEAELEEQKYRKTSTLLNTKTILSLSI